MPEIRRIDDKVTEIRFPEREPPVTVAAAIIYADEHVMLTRIATCIGGEVFYDHLLTEFAGV